MSHQDGADHEAGTDSGAHSNFITEKIGSRRQVVLRPVPADTDRLSTLPPELLRMIFEEVRLSPKKQMAGAVSQKLLPYLRGNLYRVVKIESTNSFRSFRDTINSSPTILAPLVDEFVLFLQFRPKKKPASLTRQLERLSTFFATLANTTKIVISGSALCTYTLLSSKFPAQRLTKLSKLFILDSFRGWKDPFNLRRYGTLSRYPALKSLCLVVQNHQGFDPLYKLPEPPSSFKRLKQNRSIFYLILHGHLDDRPGRTPVNTFLRHFSHLKGLGLLDLGHASFSSILNHPIRTLLVLLLQRESPYSAEEGNMVETVLSNFPNLLRIELGGKSFTPAIYDSFHLAPSLRTIKFVRGAKFTMAGIMEILRGKDPLKNLRRLFLDLDSSGEMGFPGVAEISGDLVTYGWKEPSWTEELTFKEALELMRVVKKTERIRIEGSMLRAIEVQEAYEEEITRIDRAPFEALLAAEERLLKEI